MKTIINEILHSAKIAYRESIIINNLPIEEQLLSIIGNSKLLLSQLEKNIATNKPKIINEAQVELNEINKIQRRIPLWIKRPHQKNYKILKAFMELSNNNKHSVEIAILEKKSEINNNKEFASHYSQMKIFAEKAHGKIFVEESGKVMLWQPIAGFIIKQFQITIQQAIKKILTDQGVLISANKILDHILKKNYYTFGAIEPIKAITPELTKLIDKGELTRITSGDVYLYQLNKL